MTDSSQLFRFASSRVGSLEHNLTGGKPDNDDLLKVVVNEQYKIMLLGIHQLLLEWLLGLAKFLELLDSHGLIVKEM